MFELGNGKRFKRGKGGVDVMLTAKQKKAEYDRKRRAEKSEELKIKARLYNQSEAGRAMQKRARQKRKQYHNEYCRSKDQRKKERIRNRKKRGLTKLKVCLICNQEKEYIHFEAYKVFEDGRLYMCKDCEDKDQKDNGIIMRSLLGVIRTNLLKTKSTLKVSDICKYPYLVEANKYLLLLKRLTK